MILWLNGPYGVGKSTLAEALRARLPGSFIFDAEQVGNAIRDNLPESCFHETFEEYQLWLDVCGELLTKASGACSGPVLVPMTLKMPESLHIFDKLRDSGAEVRHVLLSADADEVLRRIQMRGEEEDCWCARNIQPCLEAQRDMPCDLRLPAAQSPEMLAAIVIDSFHL